MTCLQLNHNLSSIEIPTLKAVKAPLPKKKVSWASLPEGKNCSQPIGIQHLEGNNFWKIPTPTNKFPENICHQLWPTVTSVWGHHKDGDLGETPPTHPGNQNKTWVNCCFQTQTHRVCVCVDPTLECQGTSKTTANMSPKKQHSGWVVIARRQQS